MKKLFLMALTLSSSLCVNAMSSELAAQNTENIQYSQADQKNAEDLLFKLIQIEMTYQSYLQAQDTGENTREFINSFDSHFKILSRQIESMNSSTADAKALETLDMFFKKFDSLSSSIGRVQGLREYFRTPVESVRTLKAKINNQILQNNFKQCYVKSEISNPSENGSAMIEILNALSEYKCYVNTYHTADIRTREDFKNKINEYFGVFKETVYRNSTHYSPRKNRGISLFKKRGVVANTKRNRLVSQNYYAEKDIFTQYVLGNPEELKHLNTPNGLGQNAIELAISLNLDDVAQTLTEALSDFTQTLENNRQESLPSATDTDIEQKIQRLPSTYTSKLTREEILSIIQENPNASDSVLYNKMYIKIQENTKENLGSNTSPENLQKNTKLDSSEVQKIAPRNESPFNNTKKPQNSSILSRFTLQARH